MSKVRPFRENDLPAALALADRLRRLDTEIEPFGESLGQHWSSGRARRDLWRIADGQGLSLALQRDERTIELYGAVDPRTRRKGLGSELLQPALDAAAADGLQLRASVRGTRPDGAQFLAHHGFKESSRTLILVRQGPPPTGARLTLRELDPSREGDRSVVARLSAEAMTDDIRLSSNEYARLDMALIADMHGEPAAYLCGSLRGGALTIEEVGTLPAARRRGLAKGLVAEALRRTAARIAQLAVDESNTAARALYRSLDFVEKSARTSFVRRAPPPSTDVSEPSK